MTASSPIVDTHCHASPDWNEPFDSLLYQMDANRVDRATLVQHHGQLNNDYLLAAARQHPDRFVAVVMLDTTQPDAPAQLSRLAEQGVGGLRLRPTVRSPGDDPLAIWHKAAELKLPVSTGSPQASDLASPQFAALVEELPEVTIIIEHLGWANQPVHERIDYAQWRQVFALSRHANVFMKFHGLGEFCARNMPATDPFPFEGRVTPVLDFAAAAFGSCPRSAWIRTPGRSASHPCLRAVHGATRSAGSSLEFGIFQVLRRNIGVLATLLIRQHPGQAAR